MLMSVLPNAPSKTLFNYVQLLVSVLHCVCNVMSQVPGEQETLEILTRVLYLVC